jgi:hypothetical protein
MPHPIVFFVGNGNSQMTEMIINIRLLFLSKATKPKVLGYFD